MSVALTITRPRPKYTVEQYLTLERAATDRHEYFDGEIIAMAGEKMPHGIISTNVVVALGTQLGVTAFPESRRGWLGKLG
jgi:Uma2 family endonuclease